MSSNKEISFVLSQFFVSTYVCTGLAGVVYSLATFYNEFDLTRLCSSYNLIDENNFNVCASVIQNHDMFVKSCHLDRIVGKPDILKKSLF